MDPAPRERIGTDDADILRLETVAIKGHTGKVLTLAPDSAGNPMSVAALRDRVGQRVGEFHRLVQRVEEPRLGFGRPVWAPVDYIDLHWHLAEPDPGEPLSDEEFRQAVGALLSQRLDHTRPLWRIDALPLTGGRVGLITRIHHAMADGISALRVSAGLLWDDDEGSPEPQPAAPAPPRPKAAVQPVSAGADPREPHHLLRLPAALWRELRPAAGSTLDCHIGPAREVAWTTFQLDRLKRIGRRCGDGVTVNDVVLGVVAGGLRRWLKSNSGRSLRVQVPVSLHTRDEGAADLGNRDSFMNVNLPIAEPDPVTRLRLINSDTQRRKLDHDAESLYAFFHAVGRFRPLYKGVTRLTSGPREFALSVSNVPGPRRRAVILGHPVEQFCSFAEPADRHALRVSVISLGHALAFGLCSDPEAISGLDELRGALSQSIAELDEAV